jgi:NADH-quinone oxidoreductase subunit J
MRNAECGVRNLPPARSSSSFRIPHSKIRNFLMSPVFFWTASALMLVFGAAVIANRNPVASALSLVVSFLGLAALFVSLDAFFIGIIQVLVYAGAVMVLFLFIIMLLDLRAEDRRQTNLVAVASGSAVALIFFGQLYLVIGHLRQSKLSFTALPTAQRDDVHSIGLLLFGNYNLPFQIVGVLVLVATVGVIVLSKRELR